MQPQRTAPRQIRAIVFDLGGVLFAEGKAVAREELAQIHGYEPEVIDQILSSQKSSELRRGLITDNEFWSWAQRELPKNYDAQVIRDAWYHGYILDEDIFNLIQRLKGKYRIVAFSGNIRSRIEFLDQKYHFKRLFDLEVYSFDHYRTKPDREFTAIMVQECGCRPEEILYIDDNEDYVQPARDLGVQVLIYARGEITRLEGQLRAMGIAC